MPREHFKSFLSGASPEKWVPMPLAVWKAHILLRRPHLIRLSKFQSKWCIRYFENSQLTFAVKTIDIDLLQSCDIVCLIFRNKYSHGSDNCELISVHNQILPAQRMYAITKPNALLLSGLITSVKDLKCLAVAAARKSICLMQTEPANSTPWLLRAAIRACEEGLEIDYVHIAAQRR